jgi:hypothetical protein
MRRAEIALDEAGQIIMVALVIIVIVSMLGIILGMMLSNEKEDTTLNSFKTLEKRMENMEIRDTNIQRESHLLFLKQGYYLISWRSKTETSGDNYVKPPEGCQENCFCLCTVQDGRCKEADCMEDFNFKVSYPDNIFIRGTGKMTLCIEKSFDEKEKDVRTFRITESDCKA